MIPARQQDHALVGELAAIFPAPGQIERIWLYRELQSILQAAPWVREHVGGAPVDGVLVELVERGEQSIPQSNRAAPVEIMVGDHGTVGAIVGLGVATPEMRRLKGLVWIALRRWWLKGQLPCKAADSVTSALRASVRSVRSSASHALSGVLRELATVGDYDGALRAMACLGSSSHVGLREAWNHGLSRILEIPTGDLGPPVLQDPDGASARRRERSRAVSLPRLIDRAEIQVARPDVIPLRRRDPIPEQAPHEPPDEFGAPVDIVVVPGYGAGAISRRRAEYEARQAIWSSNSLLLPTHVEALPGDVFGAALRTLIEFLEHEFGGYELGNLACLLKAVTGRTTAGIQWLCKGAPDAGIDLERGSIEFTPFWKSGNTAPANEREQEPSANPVGFFRPTRHDERAWLVPTSDRVSLPLARPVHRVLSRHREALDRLARLDALEVDRTAAEAEVRLSATLNIPLSVASLRRSLGPQIMEVSGDLALAQLVCGDSFGRPVALQHYYAPRRKDIADAYARAVCRHFPAWTTVPILQAASRVGSELLVTPEAARALARSSAEASTNFIGAAGRASTMEQHFRRVDHLARMLVATTGHRPTEALFELSLDDVDLRTGAGLFRDKRIDAAHDPRLATLPAVVCQQIMIYVRHLRNLAEEVRECRDRVEAVCTGSSPLLFGLDESLVPKRLTIAELKARSPMEWNRLPWNWGRTYLRTRGIEAGAPAFLVSCQLGHLDAVGYPYSHQSPTEPAEVVRATRPWLDRMARNQGWSVIADDSPSHAVVDRAELPPLRDWSPRIAHAEAQAIEAHRQWEQSLRRRARQSREEALKTVLDHSDLVAAGISATFRMESGAPPKPLDEPDVFRIRSELVDEVGDDAAAAVAVTRALRRVLAAVTRQTGQTYPAVPLPIAIRRPLDNPFFAGACLALSQMHALRDHVARRSTEKRPGRSFNLQVARTAESLALFGFVDDADRLVAILEGRSRAAPSAKIPDLLLVPLPDGQVFALRGLAALPLANLAQAHPAEPLPTRDELDSTLGELLPGWSTCGPDGCRNLLARLCSTTAVVNRFELSPAARFAMDVNQGSTHASLAEQLAFVDEDPTGPDRAEASPQDRDAAEEHGSAAPVSINEVSGSPRSQYRRLCQAIPRTHRDTELPLTGKRIPAKERNAPSTRRAVLAELDLQLSRGDLFPIVRLLGEWIRTEARRQKGTAKPLAYRTLETYLTRIGGALVEVFGESGVSEWTEERLEDAYLYALDASDKARYKVASALLSFHRHSSQRRDLPELDLAVLYAELGAQRQHADSSLILPVERDRALDSIRELAWEQVSNDFGEVQIARAADWVAYYLAWGGTRLGEALGLQVRDVGTRPTGMLWTTVRSNRLRPLKTQAATRSLLFDRGAREPEQRARLTQRMDDARRNAGSRRPESAYLLYAGVVRGNDATFSADAVARAIRRALAVATGRPSERLHRLRHLVATQRILNIALGTGDRAAMGLDSEPGPSERMLMPRDAQGLCVSMGHSHWRTTIQWYLHLPWVLHSRSAQHMREEYVSRQYVAGALGYTCAAIDSVLRDQPVDKVTAWFDHFRAGRQRPPVNASDAFPSSASDVPVEWTPERVGRLVDLASTTKDLEAAMRLIGAPLHDHSPVQACCERWEAKLGLRLLPTHSGGRPRRCPARAIRRTSTDSVSSALWVELSTAGSHALVDAFFTWLRPSRTHEVLLPNAEAEALVSLLRRAGVDPSDIECVPDAADIFRISVRRRDADGKPAGYRGMALKRMLAVIGISSNLRGAGYLSSR